MGYIKDFLLDISPFVLFNKMQRNFGEDIIVYLYLVLLFFLSKKLLFHYIEKYIPARSPEDVYNRQKVFRTAFLILSFAVIFPIFFSRIEYLPTLLGFTGAGLVISNKEVILNAAGWFTIMGQNGFKLGDRIEVDGVKGDVINISFMRFTILELNMELQADQSTNRMIHLPNNLVIFHKIFVVPSKMDFVWDDMKIYLSNDSDWQLAEKICEKIMYNESIVDPEEIERKVKDLSKNFLVRLGKTTPIVYTTIEEGKIVLSLRYMTRIREKRQHRSSISRGILKGIAENKKIKLLTL